MKKQEKADQPIKIHSIIIFSGCVLFIIVSFLNITYNLYLNNTEYFHLIGYILFTLSAISLVPIAYGIHAITDIYFVDHITKTGKQTALWMTAFSAAVLLDMAVLGWPFLAGLTGFIVILGRIFGFYMLNKLFKKIDKIFSLKIGSAFYSIYAFFSIVISVISAISSSVRDEAFYAFLVTFNGFVESGLMIIVGIKLIIDISRIKKYVLTKPLLPYATKVAFLIRDRKSRTEIPTTKEHIQSRTYISLLQQKTKTVETAEDLKEQQELEETFNLINCPVCSERTDMFLEHCIHCQVNLFNRKITVTSKSSEITSSEEEHKTSVRRILSIKREKVLQDLVVTVFLVTFVVYSFVSSNASLIIVSWLIIAIIATYLIIKYVVLFVFGKGYAITSIVSDLSYLFLFFPGIIIVVSYVFTIILRQFISMDDSFYRLLNVLIIITLEIIAIFVVLNRKLESANMNLKGYIKYRFDFGAREEEMRKEKERIQRKRTSFDKLDTIASRVESQEKERIVAYDKFDFKERLEDLGSPLKQQDKKRK
ncbi:MAG: hypothetical protein KGD64_11995 [Candidatus Heimdallarchaeota archaeon]|nr:hypothetical protein [Candidatus Heimdallarchaeota archaeon]